MQFSLDSSPVHNNGNCKDVKRTISVTSLDLSVDKINRILSQKLFLRETNIYNKQIEQKE